MLKIALLCLALTYVASLTYRLIVNKEPFKSKKIYDPFIKTLMLIVFIPTLTSTLYALLGALVEFLGR